MPLLHYCAESGILSRNLVKALSHQMDEEFLGQLAVEFGTTTNLHCELIINSGRRDWIGGSRSFYQIF